MEREEVTPSCGNVFADLGLENPEELLLQARIAIEIKRTVESVGKSATASAKAMGLTKKGLAELLDSPFHIPSGQLLALLNRLGQNVELVVTPKPADQAQAKVTVRSGWEEATHGQAA